MPSSFGELTAFVLLVGFVGLPGNQAQDQGPGAVAKGGHETRLQPPAFLPLPLGSIRPAGWLQKQLRIQADGLSGHLDEIWPDVKNSAWIGGKGDGWERGPYWLDGVVPLAFLLDDGPLKEKVRHWVDYILTHPQPDGWLGPVRGKNVRELKPTYDVWPVAIVLKALTQYQEATDDPRVLPAVQKCLRKLDQVLDEKPLTSWKEFADWARYRWADLVLSIDWVYDRTHEPWLLDLAAKIRRQGFDWRAHFDHFRDTGKTTRPRMWTHGVNIAMGLKEPAVWYRQSGDAGDRKAIFSMIAALDRYHGQPTGMFTCDEHLAGRNPSQGSELCAVVEYMFSLETAAAILGDARLGDRLEELAFNALPGTFKPDMCAHQYDQQNNQVVCKVARERVYVDNGPDANLYGLEPNFGCCTANLHQGWPKLTSRLWMQSSDGGLAAIAYAPCSVRARVAGKPVQVEVETDYPFAGTIRLTVHSGEAVRFPLRLRIPAWATGAEVNVQGGQPDRAQAGTYHVVEREWKGATTVTLRLPMPVRVRRGYHQSVSLQRGPLVFALRIGTDWRLLKGKPPFADWEVYPTTPWSYGLELDLDHPEKSVRFGSQPIGDRPFSPDGAPITARVWGRRVPAWGLEKNAAAAPPESPVKSDQPREELVLVPYGCTSLRLTEFPLLAR
jgi:hypothetical protein